MGALMDCCKDDDDQLMMTYYKMDQARRKVNPSLIPSVIHEEESKLATSQEESATYFSTLHRKITSRKELDDDFISTNERSNCQSFNLGRLNKKLRIMNRCTGLFLQSQLMRSKLINKSYEIRLVAEDFNEYLEWVISFESQEDQDLIRIEQPVTRVRLCAIKCPKTKMFELCGKSEDQPDQSDLWNITFIRQDNKQYTFRFQHHISQLFLSYKETKNILKKCFKPFLSLQDDLTTLWALKISKSSFLINQKMN